MWHYFILLDSFNTSAKPETLEFKQNFQQKKNPKLRINTVKYSTLKERVTYMPSSYNAA